MAKEFLKLENEVKIKFKIKPKSPLLIKLGDGKDATKSDTHIAWMTDKTPTAKTVKGKDIKVEYEKEKKTRDDREGKIFILGSTLKGMFREQFYKMHKMNNEKIDDEFGEELEKEKSDQKDVYGASNKISQLFGSKVLRSRFVAQDGELINQNFSIKDLKTRSITPIDRFTGGAVVPLSLEYTTENFLSDVYVRNISIEELKYIYFIMRDSINGEIRIGNSKTRGFGEIELAIEELEIKKYRNKSGEFDNLVEFFERDEERSEKLGDKYLYEMLKLKEKYKNIDIENPNEFILKLFGGGNNV